MSSLERRVRILELYAAVTLLIPAVLGVVAFTRGPQRFDEINVERLNVVEKDGRLRAVIANTDRMPDPIIDGKPFKTERVPGLIFYNGLGDECGGLIFGAMRNGGRYGAYGGLTFDQYRQSQSVGIVYNDHSGSRQTGLTVWDRPESSLTVLANRDEAVSRMPAGAARTAAEESLRVAKLAPACVFVGRDQERDAKVTLCDAQGHARIEMVVTASGEARLDFLDANGAVTSRVPGSPSTIGR